MAAVKRSPITNSATHRQNVTPSDDTDLDFVSTWLWVGAGGDITFTLLDGTDCTLANVPPGTKLEVHATRVKSTGTTASAIVALD